MEDVKKTDMVCGKITFPLKAALFQLSMLIGTFITIYLSKSWNYPPLAISGFAFFFVLPALSGKQIRHYYTKKCRLSFYNAHLLMETFNMRTGKPAGKTRYWYNDIVNCKLNAKYNLYSSVVLDFNNGTSGRIAFIDDAAGPDSGLVFYQQLLLRCKNISFAETGKLAVGYPITQENSLVA